MCSAGRKNLKRSSGGVVLDSDQNSDVGSQQKLEEASQEQCTTSLKSWEFKNIYILYMPAGWPRRSQKKLSTTLEPQRVNRGES